MSTREEISKLFEMRDRGEITDAELQARRGQLLGLNPSIPVPAEQLAPSAPLPPTFPTDANGPLTTESQVTEFCPTCGAVLPGDNDVCPSCGPAVPTSAAAESRVSSVAETSEPSLTCSNGHPVKSQDGLCEICGSEVDGPSRLAVEGVEPTKDDPTAAAESDKSHRRVQRVLYSRHAGARAVSGVFKALAVLALVGGTISAVEYWRSLHNNTTLTNTQIDAIVIGIVVATIIVASSCAFFGYVLSMLVDIEANTRETALNVRRGHVPRPLTRWAGAPIDRQQDEANAGVGQRF